jgi:hypothetical protein
LNEREMALVRTSIVWGLIGRVWVWSWQVKALVLNLIAMAIPRYLVDPDHAHQSTWTVSPSPYPGQWPSSVSLGGESATGTMSWLASEVEVGWKNQKRS